MKIQKIQKICKDSKRILVFNTTDCQWFSDGSALYPIYNLPRMNNEQIYTMFDIPEDDRKKYSVEIRKGIPCEYDISDFADRESLLEPNRFSINMGGVQMDPLITSQGIIFINDKYMNPFVKDKGIALYERVSTRGRPYIAVKTGLILTGIILPFNITKDLVKNLATIFTYTKMAFDAQPEDSGTVENETFPDVSESEEVEYENVQ
jgi:hypothetical protein